jgi:hypothetical protein
MTPPGNQAVNGENKHQPDVSEETGLLDSNIQTEFKRGGVHTARTMMLAGDIQCGDAAENSKTI